MCDHCGCGEEGAGFTLLRPGDDPHHHHHDHDHDHHHPHEHDHDHKHSHKHPVTAGPERILIETDVLHKNNMLAERNRGYFEARSILALNLVSSPGSGKTTILEKTMQELKERSMYVIEGDQQTSLDAERIHRSGAPVIQVNTGNGCHLDAEMIRQAVKSLGPKNGSILFIENVGNLVCPALFDLGEEYRVIIISVTEGEDKPLKYPNMFEGSQLCLINKTDLLPYLSFDLEKLRNNALKINPELQFIEMSATTGEGFGKWVEWIGKM